MLIYHGPFTNIKEMIVTTAMSTMRHQYFATWFLSDDEIKKILEKNRNQVEVAPQNVEDIKVEQTNKDEGIELVDVSTKSYKGYLLIINDPTRVKLATAPELGKVGSTLSQIIEKYDAIGGINAGGFADDAVGTGGKPSGIIIENGVLKHSDSQTAAYSVVGLDDKSRLIVSNSMTYATMKTKNLKYAVSFGPTIIVNGNATIKSGNGGWGIQPRTAIAQRKDGAVLMLVIDGRQTGSIGATLRNVQDILLKYGAYNAFNLDGGASSTMVYQSKVINSPSDIMGERYIPTAFIITK
jgi:exopolysaccharide biosynthesis protein